MAVASLEETVAALLAECGRAAQHFALEPCPTSGNNRVFRVRLPAETLVAKSYFSHASDPRDRLGAETSLLRFAENAGIGCVPRALAWRRDANIALYTHIEGCRPARTEIDAAHVDAAARFFRELNRPALRAQAASLPVASDACLSIEAHLQLADRRVARLAQIVPGGDIDCEAHRFADELSALWTSRRRKISDAASTLDAGMENELEPQARCVSPSDFGFHNAIRRPSGELCFIDFEYAGLDDPAKMACDFLCQPEVPVPETYRERFLESALAGDSAAHERTRLLLPAHRIKWACIMLSHFLPESARRRRFADPGLDEEERKRSQLDRARRSVASLLG